VLRVIDEQLGDGEGVVELAAPDEGPGGRDGGAAFPHRFGAGQVVERCSLVGLSSGTSI